MADPGIDRLVRYFTKGAPRRTLIGTAVAALLGRLPSGAVAAGCAKAGKSCRTKRCCAGARCAGGHCRCKPGFTDCGGPCVDAQADPANCGRCGRHCLVGATCTAGECFPPGACTAGFVCHDTPTLCGTDAAGVCACLATIEGSFLCSTDPCTGFPCTSSQQCVTQFGAGAACQAPNTGCCGQQCLLPCGAGTHTTAAMRGATNRGSG
jgi:hypothetical protein